MATKKIHIVVIFWKREDGTDAKIREYFSSKKKAWAYLQERREDWQYYNPSNKWGYCTSEVVN